MENFLTHIKINKLFHLENIDIPIDEKEMKHLIITGKNGSGKTILLNALTNYFQIIFFNDVHYASADESYKIYDNETPIIEAFLNNDERLSSKF
ncbi:MAG TPA: ABC transporter ATP-binding protein, partial [Prolixibacteraceae bacterium]|nr:ABC transporter ATP-binding protein [Prolixibacteraceae bacterium]